MSAIGLGKYLLDLDETQTNFRDLNILRLWGPNSVFLSQQNSISRLISRRNRMQVANISRDLLTC
jgi:hypothetical protein